MGMINMAGANMGSKDNTGYDDTLMLMPKYQNIIQSTDHK